MARFRKYGKKRRGLRRRTTRRTNRPTRTLRPRNVYYFTRYAYQGAPLSSMTTNATGQLFGRIAGQGFSGISTTIQTLTTPNSSEFGNLFDQYKVLSFTVEFHPRFTGRDIAYGAGTIADVPTIYWVYDTDDDTAPTTADEIMQRAKVYTARLDRVVRITVKYPCIAASMYASSISTGYYTKRCPWMDIVSSQVPLYGVKYMIQGPASRDYSSFFDLRAKLRLAFKNPR